jgi:hypothetical protein
MAATENLIALYNLEEQLRARSLAVIQADADLSEHWNMIAEAMNAIYAFAHDHVHASEDELLLQLLGIRLFNAAGASIKLALSGYYQKAFHQIRDVIETSFLVDYLKTHPEEIDEWRRADRKKRKTYFSAHRIRDVLDERDGYTSGARKKIYDTISELATHASYPGVSLTTTGAARMAQVGPFFDEMKLRVWLGETTMRLTPAALRLLPEDGSDVALLITLDHYMKVHQKWWSKYRGVEFKF